MKGRIAFVLVVALFAWSGAALADWDQDMPAKWVQMPDLTALGIDVNASYEFILADDFECTETGQITSIHIWGSWLGDILPFGGSPDSVYFTLSLHDDIPDSLSPTGYSMPGDVRWYRRFAPHEFSVRVWREGILEGWMDPPDMYFFPADTVCWQYNFYLDDGELYQYGAADEPVVYWLNVKAEPFDDMAVFGWKTSQEHWNDDAVWGQGYEPYFGPWFELRYPPNHELFPNSIDLAFVIVGEEPTDTDWGDAPDSPAAPQYPTLSMNGGASHVIGGPWLGDNTDSPDPEPDGQPDATATGDDVDGNDDENGVVIPPLAPAVTSVITFTVSGANGYVEGWIDYDASQSWEASEQIVGGMFATGVHAVNVTPPASAVPGLTFARFRINGGGGPVGPTGPAMDGEVEDHRVYMEEGQTFKWEQGPDLTDYGIDVNATYPYILADDFPCTEPGYITEVHVWASWLYDWIPFGVDPEAVDFTLSFHLDIPDSESHTGYSMPGEPLWWRTFTTGEFTAEVWADSIFEGWMNPPDDYWWPADYTCWLYKFYIPSGEAFYQHGSADDSIVYWLDVQAEPHDIDALFGWKTSFKHWNDDAVWGDGSEPYFGPWFELIYPPAHPLYPYSIDLAFRIYSDPLSGVPHGDAEPQGFGLEQNVPNPFSGSTTIRYSLAADGHVRLEVYDVAGRSVATLVDEVQTGGEHTATWSGKDRAGRDLPTGIYFYRLTSGRNETTSKMLFLK